MHEASIALAIVEQVSEQSAGESWDAVTSVHLRIGALTGVVRTALEFAWPFAVEGTIAQASRLVIEEVPLVVYCDLCAEEGTVSGTLPLCPRCARPAMTIVRGRELEIVSLEVRDAAPTR
jgi:hydrogenase nickel incorporation protein HypA/HybF